MTSQKNSSGKAAGHQAILFAPPVKAQDNFQPPGSLVLINDKTIRRKVVSLSCATIHHALSPGRGVCEFKQHPVKIRRAWQRIGIIMYTSDAADEEDSV